MKNIFFFLILLFITNAINAQWLQINTPSNKLIKYIAAAEKKIAIVTSSTKDSVFLSSNDGVSWSQINNGLESKQINSLTYGNSFLFVASDSGIYRSSNNGVNWELINNGLPSVKFVYSITEIGSSLFAITSHQELYKSTNNGTNWRPTSFSSSAYCITSNGKEFFAGSYGLYIAPSNGVFISSDSGITWNAINSGLPGTYVRAIAFDGSKLFTGIHSYVTETNSGRILKGEGVFTSSNNGITWQCKNTGLENTSIKSFLASGSIIFATTDNSGLYFFESIMDRWVSINNGLPYSVEYSIALNETDLFAMINNTGIWKRSLNEITTEVESTNSLPETFFLSQNYPNPFNPTTRIKYSIPIEETRRGESLYACLKIYDVLGREVATLVNEEKLPGTYEVTFNVETLYGTSLPSSVYFYRLQAGGFTETKKFVLMK